MLSTNRKKPLFIVTRVASPVKQAKKPIPTVKEKIPCPLISDTPNPSPVNLSSTLPDVANDSPLANLIDFYSQLSIGKPSSTIISNYKEFVQALKFEGSASKVALPTALRKCKSQFAQALNEALWNLVDNKDHLPKLPKAFSDNITIQSNTEQLPLTLRQLCERFNKDFTYEVTLSNVSENRKEVFVQFMAMSYQEAFSHYILSKRFMENYEAMKQKKGEKDAVLLRYASRIFISYYLSIMKKTKTHCPISELRRELQGKAIVNLERVKAGLLRDNVTSTVTSDFCLLDDKQIE